MNELMRRFIPITTTVILSGSLMTGLPLIQQPVSLPPAFAAAVRRSGKNSHPR